MRSVLKGYFVSIVSLFAGAALVHSIMAPDMVCHQLYCAIEVASSLCYLPSGAFLPADPAV